MADLWRILTRTWTAAFLAVQAFAKQTMRVALFEASCHMFVTKFMIIPPPLSSPYSYHHRSPPWMMTFPLFNECTWGGISALFGTRGLVALRLYSDLACASQYSFPPLRHWSNYQYITCDYDNCRPLGSLWGKKIASTSCRAYLRWEFQPLWKDTIEPDHDRASGIGSLLMGAFDQWQVYIFKFTGYHRHWSIYLSSRLSNCERRKPYLDPVSVWQSNSQFLRRTAPRRRQCAEIRNVVHYYNWRTVTLRW